MFFDKLKAIQNDITTIQDQVSNFIDLSKWQPTEKAKDQIQEEFQVKQEIKVEWQDQQQQLQDQENSLINNNNNSFTSSTLPLNNIQHNKHKKNNTNENIKNKSLDIQIRNQKLTNEQILQNLSEINQANLYIPQQQQQQLHQYTNYQNNLESEINSDFKNSNNNKNIYEQNNKLQNNTTFHNNPQQSSDYQVSGAQESQQLDYDHLQNQDFSSSNYKEDGVIEQSKKIKKQGKKAKNSKYQKLNHNCKTCENCIKMGYRVQDECSIYLELLRQRKKETAAEQRKKKRDEIYLLHCHIRQREKDILKYQQQIAQFQDSELKLQMQVQKQQLQICQQTQISQQLLKNLNRGENNSIVGQLQVCQNNIVEQNNNSSINSQNNNNIIGIQYDQILKQYQQQQIISEEISQLEKQDSLEQETEQQQQQQQEIQQSQQNKNQNEEEHDSKSTISQ